MSSPTAEFDATALNRTADSNKRFMMAVYLFVFLTTVGASLVLASRHWSQDVMDSWSLTRYPVDYDVIAWALFAVGALIAASGISYLRSGASRVRVTGEGLELVFPGGRILRRSWHASRPNLSLHEWPGLPNQGFAMSVGRIDTRLPREAYDFVLQRAKDLGLPTTVRSGFALYAAAKSRITWIGPPSPGALHATSTSIRRSG